MIVFDLDGTLNIVGDRLKHIQQPIKDWDAFYAASLNDKINLPIALIYNALRFKNKEIFILTGRNEKYRAITLLWLNNNDFDVRDRRLIMRPDRDYRHDTIVKPMLATPFLKDIEMVFEDRKSMADKWRELGVTCLHVAEGNF